MPYALFVNLIAAFDAGVAVYNGFKAADTPKEEKAKRKRYILYTAVFSGLSVLLLGLSCMSYMNNM